MGQLNVELRKTMRARSGRREEKPIRNRVSLEQPPTLLQRLGSAMKYVSFALLFVGGFAGGFVLVLYGVQLPGFPRFP